MSTYVCEWCGLPVSEVCMCPRGCLVVYCSDACARKDWEAGHWYICYNPENERLMWPDDVEERDRYAEERAVKAADRREMFAKARARERAGGAFK